MNPLKPNRSIRAEAQATLERMAVIGWMLFSANAGAVQVPGQGTWKSTLEPRLFAPGSVEVLAYYDSKLKVTWLANADLVDATSYPDGVSWQDAEALVNGLGVEYHDIEGHTEIVRGWRLPTVAPVDGDSFDPWISYDGSTDVGVSVPGKGWGTASELGHMYYVTLGNAYEALPSKPRDRPWNTGPFSNVSFSNVLGDTGFYWTNVPAQPLGSSHWAFRMGQGYQYYWGTEPRGHVWAVHDGDAFTLAAVPEPETWSLLFAGLLLVGAAARRTNLPTDKRPLS